MKTGFKGSERERESIQKDEQENALSRANLVQEKAYSSSRPGRRSIVKGKHILAVNPSEVISRFPIVVEESISSESGNQLIDACERTTRPWRLRRECRI